MATLQDNHDVEVHWLPFELRPEPVPLPDLDGPDGERFRLSWQQRVQPLAEQFGVLMRFNPIKPRSRMAHEAAEFARRAGSFDAMRRALFEAYFVDGLDIGSSEQLVSVGGRVGLEEQALRASLGDRTLGSSVDKLESISHGLGIRAVPTVMIGGLAVEGVRPYETLREVLSQAESRAQTASES